MADRAQPKLLRWKELTSGIRKRLRTRRPGNIMGLDVDGQVLRVVQVAPQGAGSAVTRIAAEPLNLAKDADRSDPQAVGKAIAAALDRLQIKPGPVVMGVPRALVVLRTLSMPATENLRELASMIHLQIGKDLPIRLEDAVVDFKIRPQPSAPPRLENLGPGASSTPEGKADQTATAPKLEVMVAAVRRDVVESFRQMAAAAGLELAALGWVSDAHARCVEACHVAEGDEGIALISLRLDEVGIDVIAQRSLLFSRGVTIKLTVEPPQPATTPPEPVSPPEQKDDAGTGQAVATAALESFVETVTIEVVRNLHSYGGLEPHRPVTKLFVAGSTGHEPAVVEALKNRLNVPCNLLDPVSALHLPAPAGENASGSTSALGLALAGNDPHGLSFNFLDPKRPAVQRNTRRIRTLAAAGAAAVILFALLAVRTHLIHQRLRINHQVLAELTEAEKKRPIYRQMRQQATTVQDWIKGGRDCLEHYAYLSAILPSSDDIYITSLSISGQGSIRFAVQARSGETLAKLDKQLRAAGYEVKAPAITPGTDKHGYNFKSNLELTIPEKMTIDLAKVQPPPRPSDDASAAPPRKPRRKGGNQ